MPLAPEVVSSAAARIRARYGSDPSIPDSTLVSAYRAKKLPNMGDDEFAGRVLRTPGRNAREGVSRVRAAPETPIQAPTAPGFETSRYAAPAAPERAIAEIRDPRVPPPAGPGPVQTAAQFVGGAARGAGRAAVETVTSIPEQLREFYAQASQRPPTPEEEQLLARYDPERLAAMRAGPKEAARTIAAFTPLPVPGAGHVFPAMVLGGVQGALGAGEPVVGPTGPQAPSTAVVGERLGGAALSVAMGVPELVGAGLARFRPTPKEAAAAKANIAAPASLPPQMRRVSDQASADLGKAVADIQRRTTGPVAFRAPGLTVEDAHIFPALVRVFPGEPNGVRVTVLDNATNAIHSIALPDVSALREAMTRRLPAALEKPTAAEAPAPNIEARPTVPGQIVTPEQVAAVGPARREAIGRAGAQVVANVPSVQERIRTAPAAIDALERQIADNPGDARIGRWKRRLEKLKALPSPETPASPRVGKPAQAGTAEPVPATGEAVRAKPGVPTAPAAPPKSARPFVQAFEDLARQGKTLEESTAQARALSRSEPPAGLDLGSRWAQLRAEKAVKPGREAPSTTDLQLEAFRVRERGEKAAQFEGKWQALMSAKPEGKSGAAAKMTKAEAGVALKRLRAAPGNDPAAEAALVGRLPAIVTHEMRAPGAPPVRKVTAARGIPIARATPRVPTQAEAAGLPEAEVPELPIGAKAAGLIRKVREAMGALVAATNPVRPAVGPNLDLVMRKKGEPKKALFRTEQAQEKVWKFWEDRPKGQVLDFWNRLETGVQPDARLAEIDRAYRERTANVFEAISRWKQIPFWENYFPHMWKDPKKAETFIRGRRPMEGSKSFLKARVLNDTLAGLKAGLEPVSWNPEEMIQQMEHNARKFVTVQELAEEGQAIGSMKRIRVGEKMPERFRRLNQNWARIYLNPEIELREAFDAKVMGGLNAVADALGIKRERKVRIGGKMLGYSEGAPGRTGRVVTRFATPESVLAHEIGHQIDDKYGLRETFIRKSTPAEKKELRALADLRLTGEEPTAHRQYVRSGPEKMAVMLEALIHAPEEFQRVAPLNYRKFVGFLSSRPELAPLVHIKPSLLYGESTGKVSAGGVVLGGEIVAEENLARLLDNHMSKDWVTDNAWGRGFMGSRNFLNAVELGVSGFHATGTTMLAAMSRASVGISELAHGHPIEAAKKFATTPFAPLSYARTGWKFYHGDPGLIAAIENEIFTGGASLERKQYYRNQMIDRFVRNYRRATARGGTPYERAVGGAKALGQAPFAAIEIPIKVLTTRYIPQMKVGAFRELLSSQLRIKAKDLATGKDTIENVARLAWRDIEDRFGLINYDNEFWNNGLRSAIMVLIRAPGWKLGTARALGGGVFVDMPRFAAASLGTVVERIRSGERALPEPPGQELELVGRRTIKPPEWTPRMSFALGMVFTSFVASAAYQVLHTGQAPQTLEDLLHPKNGLMNDDGTPGRINLPTFLRDVRGWTGLTVRGGKLGFKPDLPGFLFGRIQRRGGGSSLFHGGALAPEVTLILDLLENQSYRGPIRDENASNGKQVLQVMRYLFNREQPFSIQQYRALGAHQAARAEQAEAFFGMTPYHEPREQRRAHFRERY